MMKFFAKSPAAAPKDADAPSTRKEMFWRQFSVFFAIFLGYSFYYVCRWSFNVIKKTLADEGIFNAAELGTIGLAFFLTYAFGKLANGILADRVNIRRFMATGLFMSAIVNLLLGFTSWFWVFFLLWGINGWFQSFGAGSSVVAITHWYTGKTRGTFYGMWAASHNVGEAIALVGTALVVTVLGWHWGFWASGIGCIVMAMFIWQFLFERPDVYGLPHVNKPETEAQVNQSVGAKQWEVARNPVVWILALSSACFYVTRYGVGSWGIFFLEAVKGYSKLEASSIVAVNAIAGIFGTFFCGMISDLFMKGRRNFLALVFGILYAGSAAVFFFGPADATMDSLSMVVFGVSLGVLMVFLGGLMAVDICSKEVSGAVLGIVGVASYVGAALQDVIGGFLIEDAKRVVDGVDVYNFDAAAIMWVGSAVVSIFLAALVWNVRSPD